METWEYHGLPRLLIMDNHDVPIIKDIEHHSRFVKFFLLNFVI